MEALVLCFLEPGYDNIEVVRALDRWPATRGRGAGGDWGKTTSSVSDGGAVMG
jgi:hypothetical protein